MTESLTHKIHSPFKASISTKFQEAVGQLVDFTIRRTHKKRRIRFNQLNTLITTNNEKGLNQLLNSLPKKKRLNLLNSHDTHGLTPLHWATIQTCVNHKGLAIVEQLLEQGANANIGSKCSNSYFNTLPLKIAKDQLQIPGLNNKEANINKELVNILTVATKINDKKPTTNMSMTA